MSYCVSYFSNTEDFISSHCISDLMSTVKCIRVVSGVSAQTKFPSVSPFAWDYQHSPSVFVVCLRMWIFSCHFNDLLHFGCVSTVTSAGLPLKGGVKMPCHWFIHWSDCYMFCLAALSLKCGACMHLRTCTFTSSEHLSKKTKHVQFLPFSQSSSLNSAQSVSTLRCISQREGQKVMESAQGRDLWGAWLECWCHGAALPIASLVPAPLT